MEAILLSPREATVLHFVVWGYTNKEIASRLVISVKTVEAHKANGMRKLGAGGRAHLVRYAVGWGWLTRERAPALASGEHDRQSVPSARLTSTNNSSPSRETRIFHGLQQTSQS